MFKRLGKKISYAVASLILLSAQVTPFIIFAGQTAEAAQVCTTDTSGADDEPGQKDLTKLCIDYAGLPTTVAVTWNWDDTGTSGNGQSLDACSLFDTDNDGSVNYAVCVTTSDDPAVFATLTTYSCGDDKIDRCTSTSSVVSNGTTSCGVNVLSTNPFNGGNDAVANCTIQLSTVGGSSARLVDVCSYPSQQPGSDPSDCVIIADNKAKIEVKKDLSPDLDPGLFDLKINGTTYANDVGDGGTTGEHVVDSGSVAVAEFEGPSTDLANYTTTVVCKNLNGTGTIVGQSSPTGADSRQLTITAADQSDVVCVFTNTRIDGSVKVVKDVVNDNGGNKTYADFTFKNNLGSAQTFLATTSPDGERVLSLPVGSAFSITEVEANTMGYATSYSGTCSGTVTAIQQVCTITNNDVAPKLTLIKSVTKDNGGTAQPNDFNLTVGGNLVQSGVKNTYTANTPLALNETQLSGQYSFTSITGDAKCPSVLGGTVTLAPGDDITCTITNDDIAPSLTLVKIVTNNNGGNRTAVEWNLTATGSSANPTNLAGDGGATSTGTFKADTYTLGETGPSDYSPSLWTCTNSVTVNANNQITLGSGKTTTCTIYNDDDAPTLTLIKLVTNDNGGTTFASAWTLIAQAGSDTPVIEEQGAIVPNTDNLKATTDTVSVSAGIFYTLSETGGPSGYTPTSWSCDGGNFVDGAIKLALDTSITCTITNNDNQAYIVVDKTVDNTNGGSAVANDFSLTVNGNAVSDNVAYPVNPGEHTVGETNLPGYTPGTWGGDCAGDDKVTVALGETKTCTITNTSQQAYITVVKTVNKDNGGNAQPNDFKLTLEGSPVSSGVAVPVNPGTYTAGETQLDDYTFTGFSDDCNESGDVTVALGESKTCTITNDDKQPSLTLTKNYSDAGMGSGLTANSWHLKADGSQTDVEGDGYATSGTGFQAGTYTLSETGPTTGITSDPWTCNKGLAQDGVTLTVALGDNISCSITNRPIAPKLTLVKVIDGSQYGDTATVNDFGLTIGGSVYNSGEPQVLSVGGFSITEAGRDGYEFVSITGEGCPDELGGIVTLALGDDITCTITNKAKEPKLTVKKHVVNDNGGTATVNDFGITLTDTSLSFGGGSTSGDTTTYIVSPSAMTNKNYTLDEIDFAGYSEGTWSCSNETVGTGRSISFSLDLGDNLTCEVTNDDQPGEIIIHKEVINDDVSSKSATDFKYKIDNGEWTNFNILGVNSEIVNAGTYDVTEDETDTNYEATYDDCEDIVVGNGETKHCYITNTILPKPRVFVTKTAQNSGDQLFSFDVNGAPRNFAVGTYEITSLDLEQPVSIRENFNLGWFQTYRECFRTNVTFGDNEDLILSDYGDLLEKINGEFNFPVVRGENYHCTFANEEAGDVVITKINDVNNNGKKDDGEETLEGWDMVLSSDEEVPDSMTLPTNGEGQAIFENVESGWYTFEEVNKEGWTETFKYCDTDAREGDYFSVAPGEVVNCYIGNYTPTIITEAEAICENDFPYLRWNVRANGFVPTQFKFEWFTLAGNDAGTPANTLVDTQIFTPASPGVSYDSATNTYSATTLWPGADDNPLDQDWPGWKLENGIWVADPTDFGGNLRPSANVVFTVNPVVQAPAAYPPATPTCNPNPENGAVLGATTLPETGTDQRFAILVGLTIAVLAMYIGLNDKKFRKHQTYKLK